nr:acyltransferase [Photorhabdus temperata]
MHSWIPIKEVYFSFNAPSWSISTEIFFYLIFPFIITLRIRNIVTILFTLIVYQITIISNNLGENIEHALIYISPLSRVGDFSLGIIVYFIYKSINKPNKNTSSILQLLSITILILSILFCSNKDIDQVYRFDLYYTIPMSFIILSFSFSDGILSNILSKRLFVLLGEASFSLYLIHQLVIRYLLGINIKFFRFDGALFDSISVSIIIVGSIIMSILLFNFFEIPTKRFVYKRFST